MLRQIGIQNPTLLSEEAEPPPCYVQALVPPGGQELNRTWRWSWRMLEEEGRRRFTQSLWLKLSESRLLERGGACEQLGGGGLTGLALLRLQGWKVSYCFSCCHSARDF